MKKDAINIKGTINGLVICFDPKVNISELASELTTKIQARPGFFKEAKFKVHALGEDDPKVASELEKICSAYGMISHPDINWPYNDKSSTVETQLLEDISAASSEVSATNEAGSHNSKNNTIFTEETLLIQRNLRSGQKLHFNGSLVIMGDINPGAEISAGGDIIVMGSLRGIAHAGAFGNEKAIILAYRLEPTQLRIADKITRPPEKDLSANQPELARLSDGQMYIEPYSTQNRIKALV